MFSISSTINIVLIMIAFAVIQTAQDYIYVYFNL